MRKRTSPVFSRPHLPSSTFLLLLNGPNGRDTSIARISSRLLKQSSAPSMVSSGPALLASSMSAASWSPAKASCQSPSSAFPNFFGTSSCSSAATALLIRESDRSPFAHSSSRRVVLVAEAEITAPEPLRHKRDGPHLVHCRRFPCRCVEPPRRDDAAASLHRATEKSSDLSLRHQYNTPARGVCKGRAVALPDQQRSGRARAGRGAKEVGEGAARGLAARLRRRPGGGRHAARE